MDYNKQHEDIPNDVQNRLREINDEIDELNQEYFTCDVDSLRSLQIEYELECLYHLKNNLKNNLK